MMYINHVNVLTTIHKWMFEILMRLMNHWNSTVNVALLTFSGRGGEEEAKSILGVEIIKNVSREHI